MDSINNINNIHNLRKKVKTLKSKNSSLGTNLKDKCEQQENLFENMTGDLENKAWDRCMENFVELSDNSKHMRQMVVNQNVIVQDTFTLTEEILESLETLFKNKEFFCYRDWVTELIDEITVKLNNSDGMGGQDTWNNISRAFNKKIDRNKENFRKIDMPYIEKLMKILEEVDISIQEFELLIRFKRQSNNEFHKGNQSIEEAKDQLETLFPENLKDFKVPLTKALDALSSWSDD